MADAALERWRERCNAAGSKMADVVHMTWQAQSADDAADRIRDKLSSRRPFNRGGVDVRLRPTLALALQMLREEMERGDG